MRQIFYQRIFCLIPILSFLVSGCVATADYPEFTNMEFLALVNGHEASVIHLDDKGHATVEPIDFLKGHYLLGWAVASLDQMVICERGPANSNELVFKYYDHQALMQTFQIPASTSRDGDTIGPYMMFLLSAKNYLFFSSLSRDAMFRLDLKTGDRKEVIIGAESGQNPQVIDAYLGPVWDAKEDSMLVQVGEVVPGIASRKEYLAHMDPDAFLIKDKTPLTGISLGGQKVFFYQLLCYDRTDGTFIFYGQFGWPFTIYDSTGFYKWSSGAGQPKLVMKDYGLLPSLPIGKTNNAAIISDRYIITTRATNGTVPGEGSKDTHTYLVDLKTHGAQKLDMPYVTWPISQNGLHVQRTSMPASTAAQGQTKVTGTP